MKNKIMVISILIIGLFTLVFVLLRTNSADKSDNNETSSNSSTKLIDNTKENTNTVNNSSKDELWNAAVKNFETKASKYSSNGKVEGSISRFGRKFKYTFQFEAFIDGQNTDMRMFTEDEEAFIKHTDSNLFLAKDSNKNSWYKLDLPPVNIQSGENLNLNNFLNLANIAQNFNDIKPKYLKSFNCDGAICFSYEAKINNQLAEIIVNESTNTIFEVKLNANNNNISITFSDSSNTVAEAQNVEQLSNLESKKISEDTITKIVRSSIF